MAMRSGSRRRVVTPNTVPVSRMALTSRLKGIAVSHAIMAAANNSRLRVTIRVVLAVGQSGRGRCVQTGASRSAVLLKLTRTRAGILQLTCPSTMMEHGTVLTCHNMRTERPAGDSLPIIRPSTSQLIRLSWVTTTPRCRPGSLVRT